MCLDRIDPAVDKEFKRDKQGDVIAWRTFFRCADGHLHPRFAHDFLPEPTYAESCWHTDKDGRIGGLDGPRYPRGFHAYASRPKEMCSPGFPVRRVLLRGVMTFGWQDGHPVVVASKMFICKGDLK